MHKMYAIWIAAFLASGCGGKSHDTRPWSPSEEHPKGDSYFIGEETKWLPKDEFRVVSRNEGEAFARLEGTPAVELTAEETKQFIDHMPGGTGGHLVLLRALAVNERLDGFDVNWRENAVRVYHISHVIGTPKPLIRRAVIARLPALPKYAHIAIGIAE